ncbi:RNB-domain-containing protein [Linderina pennispora]|uniref:DIS3-like exonuclease 1 n=1 Tax=Linderina pennispora TaxID=61395 RepID=A0A1Y1W472_9FUNG|nr:RNB-domain-containing protein [Linderina pennispora]ORX68036.1 RNB-domain-containing protein [Linderina pennispora]
MLVARTENIGFRRSKRRGMTKNVTERYIRRDIPCGISECTSCVRNASLRDSGLPMLTSTLPVVVPDSSVVSRYIELLESQDSLRNLVFCQTVIEALDRRNRTRTIRNVRRIATDARRGSAVFANEVFAGTQIDRMHGESLAVRDMRAVRSAAAWFSQHYSVVVIVVTLRKVRKLATWRLGAADSVRVLDLDEFLATYHPALLDHYSAVTEATADKPDMDISALDPVEFAQLRLANKSKQGYASYWSPEEVAEGLRMGTLDKEPSGVIEREGKPDIVVTGRLALNRAADGDTVVVRVLAMTEETPGLGADGISEEDQDQDDADEEMAAELIDAGEEMAPASGTEKPVSGVVWRMYAGGAQHLAVPVNAHVPKIRIHYMDAAVISDLYFVYPHGHFIDVILVERQIAVLREMPVDSPTAPWQPDAAELIFSIDPKGSQDIDDAISMRRTEQGFEMGVHIADVSQFVAQARGTTVYLADRRFNMIPEVLSERICSLRGGADRYAMSVVWQMDSNYNVTDTWFGRTAQALLDGAVSAPELLRSSIVELTTAMRVLRERRRTEVKFSFDPATHAITELTPKAGLEIHRVIEEAMVFANAAVARRIHSVFPNSERFERLVKAARSRGFDIDCSSNKALAESLACIVKAAESSDPDMIFMAKSMATLAMQEAPAQFAHYGLALEYYTHFTSPIRRYADIVVHRQLDPMAAGSQKWLNRQKLFQSRYQEYLVADGVVAEVRTNGLIVYVPKYGIRGAIKIPLSTAIDGCTDFEAEADKLSVRLPINVPVFHLGSATMTFAVFDHVKVCLRVLETRRRRPPAAVQTIGKQPAYRSNVLGIDKKLGNSLVPVWSAKKKEKPALSPAAAIPDFCSKGKTTTEYYSVLAKFSQLSLLETFADVQQIEVDNTSTTSRAGLK